jgi:hypothetical protein
MKCLAMIVVWVSLVATPVWATTHQIKVDVDEPTTKADGAPLDDLSHLVFRMLKDDGTDWMTPITSPATNVAGGGHHHIQLDKRDADGTYRTGTIAVYAVNTAGDGGGNVVVSTPIPPAEPENLFVTTQTSAP